MRKINKITNIALIFMLIEVFLCSSDALSSSTKKSLRLQVGQEDDMYFRLHATQYMEAVGGQDHKRAIAIALQHLRVVDLPSIWGQREQTITNDEQFEEIVDPSLVEACKILFRKGITILLTSANSGDVMKGYAIIEIDSSSLSEENRRIAEQLNILDTT